MTEERIITTQDERGNTHTTHTVTEGSDGGGAFKWVVLLLLVAVIAVGAYLLTQTNASEIARDEAITDAANQVGEAANQIGEAAEDAADAVTGE